MASEARKQLQCIGIVLAQSTSYPPAAWDRATTQGATLIQPATGKTWRPGAPSGAWHLPCV